MIFLRVSTLESFRRVVNGVGGDWEELIEYIQHGQEGEPTTHMLVGTAWHECLSDPKGVYVGDLGYKSGPFYFLGEDVRDALALVGPGAKEVTATRKFVWQGYKVIVKGTADNVLGLTVTDHKTKFDTPDPKDYERSLQWRFYLLLHECAEFRYMLWPFKEPDQGARGLCARRGDPLAFSFHAYPGMTEECVGWLDRFLTWATDRKLIPYLERT